MQNIVSLSILLCVQVQQADFYSMPKVKGRLTVSSFPLHTSLGTNTFTTCSQKYHHKRLHLRRTGSESVFSEYPQQ